MPMLSLKLMEDAVLYILYTHIHTLFKGVEEGTSGSICNSRPQNSS